MLENGFIKLSRRVMLAWWYKELATSKLFIHMLMSANYADRMWNDVLVLRGSLVSSIRSLSSETGLSERQVRTALIHLEDKGEIKKEPSRKFTVFTITRYDFYVCGVEIYSKSEVQNSLFPMPDFGSQGGEICGWSDTQIDTENDTPNQAVCDTQNDTLISPQKSPISEGYSDFSEEERHTERHTDFSESDTQNDTENDINVINIKNNKRILMIDDARASENESENAEVREFCDYLEDVYSELTGKIATETDRKEMRRLYLHCTNRNRVVRVMRMVASRKSGAEINSFSYFMTAINRAIQLDASMAKAKAAATYRDRSPKMLRYPETATTEDYERALDQEWEMEMQRMNGTTGDKEYIYDD